MDHTPQDWNFSTCQLNATTYFSSSVEANNLYGIQQFTELMLNPVIKGHNVLPPAVAQTLDFFDPDPFIEAVKDNWQDILKQNTALLAMTAFGIAVAILLPISGIITGILYCCCCGSKKGSPVQKNDTLCLCLEGFVYLVLITLAWLGIAWLILSDLAMQKGIDQLPDVFDG